MTADTPPQPLAQITIDGHITGADDDGLDLTVTGCRISFAAPLAHPDIPASERAAFLNEFLRRLLASDLTEAVDVTSLSGGDR